MSTTLKPIKTPRLKCIHSSPKIKPSLLNAFTKNICKKKEIKNAKLTISTKMLKLKIILTKIPCEGEPQKNIAKKDKRLTMPIRIIPVRK